VKPYQKVPIQECGEALVPISPSQFAIVTPHPYVALGAPYGSFSPYFLRQGVLQRLIQAQGYLHSQHPGWQLQIFDAYRPIAVQQFMVDYAFGQQVKAAGLSIDDLSDELRSRIQAEVLKFWAQPSADPLMPPPHSTGAAVDLTLVNVAGEPLDMGSPIDEISPRSWPNYFAERADEASRQCHRHRCTLAEAMSAAGFRQHPNEWWHFSYGDQLWAWQVGMVAHYGNAHLLNLSEV
jgi:zinc D-Ala-D-Ala dipeptidase